MKIAICVPCYSTDVKLWFMQSYTHTTYPKDSTILELFAPGQWTPNACYTMVSEALKWGAKYIVIISADVGWERDDIRRMIEYRKDVIGGWAQGRFSPFVMHVAIKRNGYHFDLAKAPDENKKGIEKVCALGGELVVYDARVFSKMPEPWFFGAWMFHNEPDNYRMATEDYFFATQAERYGVEIWVDWETRLKHAVDGLFTHNGKIESML